MNIYDVEITGNIVVAARSPQEAEEKALHLIRIGGLTYELDVEDTKIITKTTEIPNGWGKNDLPFGTDDDKTVGEYFACG